MLQQILQVTLDSKSKAPQQEHMQIENVTTLPLIGVLIKFKGYQSFAVDSMIDTGSAGSYAKKGLFPPHLIQKLDEPRQVVYGNGSHGLITEFVHIWIQIGEARLPVRLFIHNKGMKYDMIIGIDILRNLYPFTFDHTHIRFYYQSKSYSSPVKHWPSFLISNICEAKVGYCDDKFRDWFNQEKDKYNPELSTVQSQIMKHSSENPLAL